MSAERPEPATLVFERSPSGWPAAAEAAAQVAARAELPLAGALPAWASASARRRARRRALALLVVGVAAHFAWPLLFD